MTDIARLQTALAKVRERFNDALPAREASISRLLEEVERGRLTTDCVFDARMSLHKIAGTAETLGFQDLGRAAAASEDELANYCRESEPAIDLADRLRVVLDRMAQAQRC